MTPAGLRKSVLCLVLVLMNLQTTQADPRLVQAIKDGDKAGIHALLQQRVDVNSAESDGTTPLYWAVYLDDLETVRLLIKHGANPKSVNLRGVAPISLAAVNGDAKIIENLLRSGADPNAVLPGGETVLMTAARTGDPQAIEVLLANGADVNATERHGQTALMWAAAEGHAEAIQSLVKNGADLRARSKRGFTALLFAVRQGKINAVRALLKAGDDANTLLEPGLEDQSGDLPGISALVLAVSTAHYELASLLLDAGADPNVDAAGWTALHEVIWIRKPGYGANGPSPQGSGNVDSLELVRRLVAHGANVNARMKRKPNNMGMSVLNYFGATPFLVAAETADVELMRLLVDLGADPLLPNADTTTPLMAAAGLGTAILEDDAGTGTEALEAVKLALDLGADINAIDGYGNTAMHGAALKEVPSIIYLLAEKGARIDVKNRSGSTPLSIAENVANKTPRNLATVAAIRQLIHGDTESKE
jgi:uncharacterized protein